MPGETDEGQMKPTGQCVSGHTRVTDAAMQLSGKGGTITGSWNYLDENTKRDPYLSHVQNQFEVGWWWKHKRQTLNF